MAGRPQATSSSVSVRMKVTRQRDTPGEVALRSALHRLGYRFRVDISPLPGTRRRADIVFRRQHVAIYIDGCFWHGCPVHGTWPKTNAVWWRSKIEANQRRDRSTDEQLAALGWTVIRVWEHESTASSVGLVIGALRAYAGIPASQVEGAGSSHSSRAAAFGSRFPSSSRSPSAKP